MVDKYTKIFTFDATLQKAMYRVYGGKCFYTGRRVSFDEMRIDHIVPIENEGKDCISNYVLTSSFIKSQRDGTYTDKFGISAKGLNDLLYVDKVVAEYNEIAINSKCFEELIEVNQYFREKNITGKERHRLRQLFMRSLKSYKIVREGKKRGKVYYDREEIIRLLSQNDTKRKSGLGNYQIHNEGE